MNKYDPKVSEPNLQKYWADNKIYAFDKKSKKPIYSIDTPPPTVSGKMHLGHSFSYSQQDFIARYKRMNNHNVFYPFGTDDNGLPTQLLIQRTKKVRAIDLGREEFRKLCVDTLNNELRPKYVADWKAIGMSCDFDLFYTTINDHCRKISQQSFIDLYKAGREYRTEAAAMYCPKCKTAISQVECEDKELQSSFNDIVFKVDEKDLIIATTRPELLPACVAIFYHPEDKKYQKLKGKKAKVPLFDFEVPILEDERANPEKGTGIVMCCTFGDATDMEWQKAHQLPIKMAIGKDGKMTDIAGKYQGKKIKDARAEIIEDLKNAKLLIKQEPVTHTVNVHERCGTEIEFVHSKQWFIKYLDLKDDMLKWGKKLNWFPEHMKNRYDNWVKGLQWDWCISRQIYYGVPFPVWYCEKCDEIILAKEEDLPVDPIIDKPPISKCPRCGHDKIVPETDVINTWATSSLTPQIAAQLVPEMFDKIYPMSLRPQAHDIISFWLFNTVVKSQLHYHKNPWKDCLISGWALDPKGKKMSKSKGNVIEPQKMIEKYSADCLRYWASGSKLGEDVPFQEKDLVTGQKLVTKLWNASKFCFMHLEDYDLKKPKKLELMDKWLLTKLNALITSATEDFDNYAYSKARASTELFFKNTFCDYYLEIIKDRIYNPDVRGKNERKSAQYTLYHALQSILKLFAPIMPHITDEIYSYYFNDHEAVKSIHVSEWPKPNEKNIDEDAEALGEIFANILAEVRKFKSDNSISLKEPIKSITINVDNSIFEKLKDAELDLKATTKAQLIQIGKKDSELIKIEK